MRRHAIGLIVLISISFSLTFAAGPPALSGSSPADAGEVTSGEARDSDGSLCSYVDPFIGTRDMGHTFPGATVPFGMVQLSPDTDTLLFTYGQGYNPDVYRYCAGYQYDDPTIVGFSHTHFNGTGHSDLGDFLLMPATGSVMLNPGTEDDPDSGYRSRYSKASEEAHPGYYAVTLDDYDIQVELTATERVGFHKYTFNNTFAAAPAAARDGSGTQP
ncbi:MAG TPA: hypothetical protein VLA34_01725, partial [Candidatus Krumholzibacterium sp.]|nr:hypothetical protein [Candidatus Krumholzibacterium sp.]